MSRDDLFENLVTRNQSVRHAISELDEEIFESVNLGELLDEIRIFPSPLARKRLSGGRLSAKRGENNSVVGNSSKSPRSSMSGRGYPRRKDQSSTGSHASDFLLNPSNFSQLQPTDSRVQSHLQKLYRAKELTVNDNICKMMPFQFCLCVVLAFLNDGNFSTKVFLAASLVMMLVSCWASCKTRNFARSIRLVIASTQALVSATLIHCSVGRIECHFHIFIILSFLASYNSMDVIVLFALLTALHHLVAGYFMPMYVYGEEEFSILRVFEHAGWLLFQTLVLCWLIRTFMRKEEDLAMSNIKMEMVCQSLETRVQRRTKELRNEMLVSHANHTKLYKVVETCSQGVLMVDQDGLVVFANKAAVSMFGEGLVGKLHNDPAYFNFTGPDGLPLPSDQYPHLLVHNKGESSKVCIGEGLCLGIRNKHDKETQQNKQSGAGLLQLLVNGDVARVGIDEDLGGDNGMAGDKDGFQGCGIDASSMSILFFRDITSDVKQREALIKSKVQAEEAAKTKSTFLSTMSHELRTPMNGIVGLVNLLKDTEPLTEEQQEYMLNILSCSHLLLSIINEILDFSKMEHQKGVSLECLPINTTGFIEQTLELLATTGRQKQIELLWAVSEEVPETIWGDPTRIKQVLINMTSNALKFTSKGQVIVEVTVVSSRLDGVSNMLVDQSEADWDFDLLDDGENISVREHKHHSASSQEPKGSVSSSTSGTDLGGPTDVQGAREGEHKDNGEEGNQDEKVTHHRIVKGMLKRVVSPLYKDHGSGALSPARGAEEGEKWLHFEVRDTGIGVEATRATELLMPFSQADNSTTRRFGGTGLGLAICRKIIHNHNGAVGVRSRTGRGSCFWFNLPLITKPAPQSLDLLPSHSNYAGPANILLQPGPLIPGSVKRVRLLVLHSTPVVHKVFASLARRLSSQAGGAVAFDIDCFLDIDQAVAAMANLKLLHNLNYDAAFVQYRPASAADPNATFNATSSSSKTPTNKSRSSTPESSSNSIATPSLNSFSLSNHAEYRQISHLLRLKAQDPTTKVVVMVCGEQLLITEPKKNDSEYQDLYEDDLDFGYGGFPNLLDMPNGPRQPPIAGGLASTKSVTKLVSRVVDFQVSTPLTCRKMGRALNAVFQQATGSRTGSRTPTGSRNSSGHSPADSPRAQSRQYVTSSRLNPNSSSRDLLCGAMEHTGDKEAENREDLLWLLKLRSEKVKAAAVQSRPSPSKLAVQSPAEEDYSGLRVLLAEDNAMNQKVAKRMLQRAGVKDITLAMNGKEAVAAYRKQPFDICLMDWHMPEMDGLEAAREIRKLEKEFQSSGTEEEAKRAPLFIAATTASVLEGDQKTCLEAGMDVFCSKPLRPQSIKSVINSFIQKKTGRSGSLKRRPSSLLSATSSSPTSL